jgi:hypothetical protein
MWWKSFYMIIVATANLQNVLKRCSISMYDNLVDAYPYVYILAIAYVVSFYFVWTYLCSKPGARNILILCNLFWKETEAGNYCYLKKKINVWLFMQRIVSVIKD